MKIRLTCRQKDGDLVTTTSTVLDGKQLAEYFLREGLEINRKQEEEVLERVYRQVLVLAAFRGDVTISAEKVKEG